MSGLQFKDGKIQEVVPEPTILSGNQQTAFIEIGVGEVMYPAGWKPTGTIRYAFGGGWFEVGQIKKDTIVKELIYLMQLDPYDDPKVVGALFLPSYLWHLVKSLDQKDEISEILDERVKRENKAKEK